jgi:sRNA-binding regulator protein Hfq
MSLESKLSSTGKQSTAPPARASNRQGSVSNLRPPEYPYGQSHGQEIAQRQAELFYMQKQIQAQTPMVIVLEDGETVEGCIEWYDRNVLKVRGRSKTLIYKAAIKYLYKLGDAGR